MARSSWWVLGCLFVVGLNLRAAIGALPPLLGPITAEFGLTGVEQGLLTSAAVICMAACAPLGPALSAAVGPERAMSVVLAVIAVGSAARLVVPGTTTLVLTVAVVGAAMGLGSSTVAPSIIARHLSAIRGRATGVFMTGMELIPVVTSGHVAAGRLGAMVFTVAFSLGAAGPVLFGGLRDLTGGYAAGLAVVLLLAGAALTVLPALRPGRAVA